jgi:hypothetical protein
MLAASAWAAPPAETLLATFASVLQRVATIRQLPLLKPIARAVRTRQQIRDSVAVLIREEMSPQEWEAERQAMIQWGLIPADFQLQAFVLDLLTEQAAGYYDPKQQQFFIADWLPEAVQEPVIAHELVHALQDQYYHLQANFDLVKDQSDLTLARKALVEGDAVAVMFVYMLEPLGLKLDQLPDMQALIQTGAALMGDQFQVYTKAPLILRQQLIFPYAQGLTFVKAALAQGGWATLAQVYAQPPLSTEQILHPEKYFTATPELPSTVNLHIAQEALAGPWTMVKRDVLGEFLLSVILQQFLPEDEARRSAAGWRGDRYELWQRQDDSRSLLVCVTDWDTPAEATEFLHSYQKLLAVKYPVWTLNADVDHSSYLWQHDDGRLLLRQHGQMVHLVEGATAADLPYLQTLLDQVTAVPLAQR